MIRLRLFGLIAILFVASALLSACAAAPRDSAAVVNGEVVSTHYYDVLVNASKRRAEQVGITPAWDTPQGVRRLTSIQSGAIRRLVQNAVVGQIANQRGVSVSDSDLDQALVRIDAAYGGTAAVDGRLDQSGMTREDFRALYRYFLLDQKLRQFDPTGYPSALDQALKDARVSVFVAPCSNNHDYASCLDSAGN
jgi:hypothetical protein